MKVGKQRSYIFSPDVPFEASNAVKDLCVLRLTSVLHLADPAMQARESMAGTRSPSRGHMVPLLVVVLGLVMVLPETSRGYQFPASVLSSVFRRLSALKQPPIHHCQPENFNLD
jgi:hypothetical protein